MLLSADIQRKPLWWVNTLGLCLLLGWVVWHLFRFDMNNHGYILGDWLINFQDGGFKRRGLSGSFFFLLQDLTGAPLQYLVFGFQSLAYLIFLTLLFLIIRERPMDMPFTLFMWSPVTLLCYVQEPTILGRKEVLFFLIFTLYSLETKKGNPGKGRHAIYFASLSAMTLFHEIALFYAPFFILLRRLHFKGERLLSYENIGFMASVLIPVVAIKLWGGSINNGLSAGILESRGVEITDGILFLNDDLVQDVYKRNVLRHFTYFLAYLYGFMLLLLCLPGRHRKEFVIGFLACTAYSIPLFYLALDWGRWVQIHFMLCLIIVATLLPEPGTASEYTRLPARARMALCTVLLLLNISLHVKHSYKGVLLNRSLISLVRNLSPEKKPVPGP